MESASRCASGASKKQNEYMAVRHNVVKCSNLCRFTWQSIHANTQCNQLKSLTEMPCPCVLMVALVPRESDSAYVTSRVIDVDFAGSESGAGHGRHWD